MNRCVLFAVCALTSLSCLGDGEKIPLPPLPQDGTPVPYSQVLTRLSAQTNTAKEELFLNHWDGLADASTNLERSAGYLLKAPDLPPTHKAAIEKTAGELQGNVVKLRDAARKKEQNDALELIRRLHNQVRELQDLK